MPETGEQRRRFFRRRMLKGARIAFNNGSSIFSCTIRDISEGGARLEIGNTLGIPDEFTLTMEDGSASFPCRVRRRTMTTLGVEFVSA
jgi:c-di-GMP-binding flagellar brake protein YcgR